MAVNGNISPKREENPKIYLNNIVPLVPASPSVLYIKVPSIHENAAVNLIERSIAKNAKNGTHEVRIYDNSTGKLYSRKNPGVNLTAELTAELENLLGGENVKVK